MKTYSSLLAEGVGFPEGFLQRMKSWHQAVAQLQSGTDKDTTSVTDAHTRTWFVHWVWYVYLTCLADAVAVSFVVLSAAGFNFGWLEKTVVSDWTLYCCLVEQVTEVLMELCSGADSVLDDVEVISWVTVCFSDDWLTVSLEADSFSGCGGVGVELEAGCCEAQFCTTVSIAGDCRGSSAPAGAESFGLCCESGMTAGSLTAVCWGTLLLPGGWDASLWVICWCWIVDSGSFSLASWYSLESLPSSELSLLLSSDDVDS